MHHFSYVPKKEAAPYKEKVIELINAVQDEVTLFSESVNQIYDEYSLLRKPLSRYATCSAYDLIQLFTKQKPIANSK